MTDTEALHICRSNPFLSSARLLACAALCCLSGLASAQVPLATVVELAQRNSSAVHLAQANLNKATAAYSESRDSLIPSVTVASGVPTFPSAGFTGTPSSIFAASVQSLIYSIPQRHYISSASLAVKSAKINLEDAREQAALEASTAYVELDFIQRELVLIHQQEEASLRLVQIEQQRAEAGVDPLSAVLEARLTSKQMRLKRFHLEARAEILTAQIVALTGLRTEAVLVDHSSIPDIPQIRPGASARTLPGIEAAHLLAQSRMLQAKGDQEINSLPQLSFSAQYFRNTTLLNDVNSYYKRPLPANNFSSGISVQIPIFDMGHRAKTRGSAADALKTKVESEQAEHQNDLEVARLDASIRELDELAEIASLKQQIAQEQLKAVLAQLELGTGSDAAPQLSPKAEQLARIDERQKLEDSLEAELNLSKARLGLLRALGHLSDWLAELKTK